MVHYSIILRPYIIHRLPTDTQEIKSMFVIYSPGDDPGGGGGGGGGGGWLATPLTCKPHPLLRPDKSFI